MKYERAKLNYGLNDLEPIIYYSTMYYHYEVLHKNYETKLEETLKGTNLESKYPTLEELMENLEQLPEEIRDDVRFFGGGLINHNFFFTHLKKFKTKEKNYQVEEDIDPHLLSVIKEKFTDLENLKRKLVKSALAVRGSGWTWLVINQKKELGILNTANQDGPWSLHCQPIIAIDVWEHAYYLDYRANRKEYVEKLLEHLLNWEYINEVYIKISAIR